MTILWVVCILVNFSPSQVSAHAPHRNTGNATLGARLDSVLNDAQPPCHSIFGVVCDGEGSVVGISWTNLNLSGILDDRWTSLGNLTSLDLSGNVVKGTLPPSWASLENLANLNLANNSIVGSLPLEWSSLTSLRTLDLRGNDVSLEIPSEWELLPLNSPLFELQLEHETMDQAARRQGGLGHKGSILDPAAPTSRNILGVPSPPPSAGATIVFFSNPPPPTRPPPPLPPPPISPPADETYFWVASQWYECSVSCGGGVQRRTVVCVKISENQGEAVDEGLCGSGKPDAERSCNSPPCLSYAYEVGSWSACDADCGWGWQTRSVHCREVESHGVASYEHCQSVKPADMRECFGGVCPPYRWKHGNWLPCNASCGGGIATRTAKCYESSTDAVVPEGFCGSVGVLDRMCNTSPCKTHRWQVGPWSECSELCDGGTRTRSVVCVSGPGVTEDAVCEGQKPISIMPCNTQACEPKQCGCRPPSLCVQGKCQCLLGYSGSSCEVPPRCGMGIADKKGECCPSGILEVNRQCCGLGSQQGKDGTCCLEERLDACGECNGPAKTVDITGACCNGLIDEGGICCKSQIIDECGICDGDGTTCGVSLALDITIPLVAGLDDTSSTEFREVAFNVTRIVSSNANIPIENLRVTKIGTAPATRQLLSQVSREIFLEVVPPWTLPLPEPEGRLTGEHIAREFDKVTGHEAYGMSFNGVGSENPQRVALCGNGVCEAGERPTGEDWDAPENVNACFADCPFVWKRCPGTPPCGSHGKCLPADGLCECFTGYAGDSCDECSDRYVREGDLCVTEQIEWGGLQTTEPRNTYTPPLALPNQPNENQPPQSSDPPGVSPKKDDTHGTLAKAIGGGVGVAVLLVATIVGIRVLHKRRARKTRDNHNIEEELGVVGRMRSLDRLRFKKRMQRMQEKQKTGSIPRAKERMAPDACPAGSEFSGRMDPFHRYLRQDST